MDAGTLSDALNLVCPIIDVRVVKGDDRTTWTFNPAPGATVPQITAANNVIATIDPVVKKTIKVSDFIKRWTTAEYRVMLADRATAAGGGSMSVAKNWDVALALDEINLNAPMIQNLKADIVTAGILTQPRADIIFS